MKKGRRRKEDLMILKNLKKRRRLDDLEELDGGERTVVVLEWSPIVKGWSGRKKEGRVEWP